MKILCMQDCFLREIANKFIVREITLNKNLINLLLQNSAILLDKIGSANKSLPLKNLLQECLVFQWYVHKFATFIRPFMVLLIDSGDILCTPNVRWETGRPLIF